MEKNTLLAGFVMPHPPIIVPGVSHEPPLARKTIAAMQELDRKMALLKPDTVVLISPHAPYFQDYLYLYDEDVLSGSMADFSADQVSLRFELDRSLLESFTQLATDAGISAGGLTRAQLRRHSLTKQLDHGAFVPLYFLNQSSSFKLLVMSSPDMGLGRLYRIGRLISQAAGQLKRKIVIIASGDQSHKANSQSPYGFDPAGAEYDALLVKAIEQNRLADFFLLDAGRRERAAECGFRSLVMLGGALDEQSFNSTLLSYEAPYGIGYCVACFRPDPAGRQLLADPFAQDRNRQGQDESLPVQLARQAISHWLEKAEPLSTKACPGQDQAWLLEKSGVFVTLYEDEKLRGCIGTYAATTDSILAEICQNAVSAATEDPRFRPVRADELPDLTISVDILGRPQPVQSKDELDPKQFGVIVQARGRRGLLLPDLAGVDTVEEQLGIACEKAGIPEGQAYSIEKFQVRRYS